ncbi:MAG: protease complex subunit PrcB family protein [Cyanobacteria bacterium P01_D01_bin.156]
MKALLSLLISSSLCIADCTALTVSTPTSSQPMETIDFEPIPLSAPGLNQRYIAELTLWIIRDESDWQAFWRQQQRLLSEPPPLPDIDFTAQMLLVLTLGSRPTGGYGLEIDRIELLETTQPTWRIYYLERVPGKTCLVTQQTTTPTAFVSVPLSNAEIELTGQILVNNCEH